MQVTTYSGGWKMKMQLCAATLMNADILMLDEPTGHLDVTNIAWIKILNEAIDAKAAKILIWPTLETIVGIVFAPMKYPTKYPDIIAPVARKLNSSITALTPSKLPWKPCATISTP